MTPYEIKKVTYDVENDCIIVTIEDSNRNDNVDVCLSACHIMNLYDQIEMARKKNEIQKH